MPLPTITALPSAPSRSGTPASFNSDADAFVAALPTLVTEVNAWSAALPATISTTDFSGTSTTSLTIGTGSKSLTIQAGKNFAIGQPVRIAYTVTPANYMDGQVTAYNPTTGAMTVNATSVGGAGTQSAWTVALIPGAGGSYATLTGSETLTNKTFTTPVLSGTASGTTAGRIGYSAGVFTGGNGSVELTFATLTGTQTLTNKTIDFAVGGNVGKINGNTFAATAGTATITFPNSTDTLVGRTTTDTLTNKTLTAPAINGGTISADAAVSDTGTIAAASPGFRGLPLSSNATATLALTDAGKMLVVSVNQTIPANASVAFPVGTVILIVNNSASTITVAITTDTMRQAGTSNTGTRTIAAYGECSLLKIGATTWIASGNLT